LEQTFAVGTIHEGTVIRKDDKGALVQLPYGLEGFAPGRHLGKEDGKTIGADETASFMVIEFDRNESALYCRIPVSGSRPRPTKRKLPGKKQRLMQTRLARL